MMIGVGFLSQHPLLTSMSFKQKDKLDKKLQVNCQVFAKNGATTHNYICTILFSKYLVFLCCTLGNGCIKGFQI